jgi:lysozyme
MQFNLGGRLLTFRHALAAMRMADWATAAAEMRSSLWALQVGARADRLARAMETGEMPSA